MRKVFGGVCFAIGGSNLAFGYLKMIYNETGVVTAFIIGGFFVLLSLWLMFFPSKKHSKKDYSAH